MISIYDIFLLANLSNVLFLNLKLISLQQASQNNVTTDITGIRINHNKIK